ncbi:MAG: hypothetical protein H6735_15425 [Alphaproteobacteria bacterium]|nr:hypothetical protein [Alphaproteobacteria bacterium]
MGGLTRELQVFEDPWVGRSRTILKVGGTFFLVVGVLSGPLSTSAVWVQPDVSVVMALGVTFLATLAALGLFATVGILNFVASAGLKRGARWGWILTVLIGLLYTVSLCMPFGLALLYGMLNERTRKSYTTIVEA